MSINTERLYKILLVDDSESDRAIYCRYLLTDEDVDYQILEAETLAESLELWRSQFPDMVLADLHLPDGNGLELLTAIQEKDMRQKCPVIVITGQGNEQIAVQAMKLGARDYLVKDDITATILGNCVKKTLNEWTTSQELTEFSQESENYNLGNIPNIRDRQRAEQDIQLLNQALEHKVEERTATLRVTEAINKSILNAIPDLLLRVSQNGTCLDYFDPKIDKHLFVPIEHHLAEVLPPDLLQTQLQAIQQAIATEELQIYEHELKKQDRMAYEEVRILAINDQEVLMIIRDISDRKYQEKELRESENRFRQLAENIDDVVYLVDIEANQMLYISPSYEVIWQRSCQSLYDAPESYLENVYEEDRLKVIQAYEQKRLKNNTQVEYRIVLPDGSLRWILDSSFIVKTDTTEGTRACGIAKDISDRKQAEIALRESEQFNRQLITEFPVGLVSCRMDGQLVYVNPVYAQILGRSVEETLALTYWDITPIKYVEQEAQQLRQLQETGSYGPYEKEYIHADGHLIAVSLTGLLVERNGETLIWSSVQDISDRKQSEKALLESQQFLQTVLDSFPLAIFWKNRESVLLGCNQFFARISELDSPEAVVGKTNFDFSYTEAEAQSYLLDDQQVMRSGISLVGIEETITLPTGETRWTETNKIPLRDLEGNVIGILGTFQDITERVENRQKLVELTDRLKIALNSGAIGYWEWDIAHKTLTWDERMYELYDIPKGTTVQFETWTNTLHPDDRQLMATLTEQVVAGEAEFNTEFRVIHPDHSIHFLKSYGLVMRDERGNPLSIIGVNFDITEQKQAEQTIHQQIEKETLLRQITQHIRETLDLQTIFDTACQEIRQFIHSDRVGIFRFYPDSGYDDGEFVAESLQEGFSSVLAIRVHDHCFGEDYSQRYAEGYFQAVNDVLKSDLQDCHKEVLTQFQIRANLIMPLLLGEQLWGLLCIHACAAPRIWQPDEIDLIQQIAGQLAIAIQQADLFEQLQQKQEKLTQTNKDLARATRLKDEFLANMSHELRTPLTAILGMAEALQTNTFGELNSGQEKAIKLIEKSGEHLLSLITDILDLSKIEAGKLELKFASTPVKTLCENSTMFVKQMALTKKIELQTRIPENIEQIWVDEFRIRQSLINLLSNAIKFTPTGGNVILSVALEQQEILFSVTDTGIGISPSDLDKLFQRFVQIDSSLNRQYAGTGLGLVLVERIITKHGGRVSVTSRVGEGSCFTLRLPYVPSSRKSIPENVKTTLLPTQQKNPLLSVSPLILLADDDEGNRKTLDDYLSNKGYRMLLAYNGKEAVEMVKSHRPDLILMDIQMPEMDGLEATTLIRSDPAIAHIPIIALTALALPEQVERCLAVGINEYLVKPLRFKVLMETIQKFC
ncbi:MAG: response regulator [Snowella sp.]|nr:response regulator [Snowella sp.]